MRLENVASLLRGIADRGGGFGSQTEQVLRELADALAQNPDIELTKLRQMLKPKTARQKAAVPLNEELVQQYLQAFHSAGSVEEASSLLERLGSDKKVKKAEAVVVAQRFTGITKSLTKIAALEAIRDVVCRKEWDRGALDIIRSRAVRY